LILRFYDPYRGDIFLDGMSIKGINIQWLRSQIGYVGQEPILFAGTIGDNIAYGLDPSFMGTIDKQMLREKVVAAAKLANAHEFISSFPQGMDD
jgi:ATP-binding cassette subfamily B (MDR/TAP) protein 1